MFLRFFLNDCKNYLINFFKYSFKKKSINKLLFIYDFTTQPISLGDFILANATSIAYSNIKKLNYVDILLIFDSEGKDKLDDFKYLDDKKIKDFVFSLFPIVRFNKKMSSIFIINNKISAESFISKAEKNYKEFYPSLFKYRGGSYYYWDSLNKILPKHYRKFGSLIIECTPWLSEWTENFFNNKAKNSRVVTVNFRVNNSFGINRNSNLNEWDTFFRYANDKYPHFKFVIISSQNEIQKSWLNLDNVIVAKMFNTTIEQDLALILNSEFHMGTASGPFTIALFGKNPYIMFNIEKQIIETYNTQILKEKNYFKYSFALEGQLMTDKKDTFNQILKEFERIVLAQQT